ncbi:hypothetical protein M0804_006592 [Polistes exclamans]|nr:hypothetical protein M0804_006592 [Polistes exclamans]
MEGGDGGGGGGCGVSGGGEGGGGVDRRGIQTKYVISTTRMQLKLIIAERKRVEMVGTAGITLPVPPYNLPSWYRTPVRAPESPGSCLYLRTNTRQTSLPSLTLWYRRRRFVLTLSKLWLPLLTTI